MSTAPLNPLVTKIRAMHPGSYDDMDDAALTKAVLRKYPQYSDLAAPPMPSAIPAGLQGPPATSLEQRFPIAPQGDESFQQTMQRGAKAGKTVTPEELQGQALSGVQQLPGVLAAAPAMGAAGAAGLAGAGAALPAVLPFLKRAWTGVKANLPTILTMKAIEEARKIPYAGKLVPPGAEWLPFLMGHEKGPAAEVEPTYPGAPLPEAPSPATLQSRSLANVPETGALPEAQTGEALAQRPSLPFIPKPAAATPSVSPSDLESQLQQSLGAAKLNPKVPIYERTPVPSAPEAPPIPEGHTPVESSAVRSYRYDPEAREFHAHPKTGTTTYVYGDVGQEDADAFARAESKGQAWQQIRRNPLVAKIQNGKRVPVTPTGARAAGAE